MAFLLPFMPEFEIPVAHAEGGGSTTIIENITVNGDGELGISEAQSVSITGTNQSMSIDSEHTNIYVSGDYYKETEQFNPVVGELYSGNYSMSCKDQCLWSPKLSELPSWFVDQVMHDYGYSMLYTGFMEMDNIYGYKPYGTTRVGETLGYDVYAANGEWFDRDMSSSGNLKEYRPSGVTILKDESQVSPTWALINSYRAVGVELYSFGIAAVPKFTIHKGADNKEKQVGSPIVAAVCGEAKLTDGKWDINKSPISSALSGNIEAGFTGDSKPVVLVYSSRTNPTCYVDQAKTDLIEYDKGTDRTISCADFCKLVADLMEAYGEPVLTEMEEYMLLEAYGRKLPYELFPAQLESIKYLIVRGIIDGTDELAKMGGEGRDTNGDGAPDTWEWDWSHPINFKQASTILMRVKDKGSRLTFKEFQLTTDLSLLKNGYYPVDIAIDNNQFCETQPLAYLPATEATHYDYFVRRADNRALFLSSNEEAIADTGVMQETSPHVSNGDLDPASRLPDSYYRGRTKNGWYWFQVPIDYEPDFVYINSAHADNDSPAQYKLSRGGGYYVMDTGAGSGETVLEQSHRAFDESDDGSYVDVGRFMKDAATATTQTAEAAQDRNRTCAFMVTVSKTILEEPANDNKTWNGDNATKFVKDKITDTHTYHMPECYPFYNNLPEYGSDTSTGTAPPVVWVKQGTPTPLFAEEEGAVKCTIWKSPTDNSSYQTYIVESEFAISADMARAALNLEDLVGAAVGNSSPARTVRAYCRSNSEYMVSVSYLKSMGSITLFDDWGNERYFISVPDRIGDLPDIDVYIDCGRKAGSMVLWGSTAFIYEKGELVINNMKDDYFINLTAIDGRLERSGMNIAGDSGIVINTISPISTVPRPVYARGNEMDYVVGAECISYTQPDGTAGYQWYMNLALPNPKANYVAVFDMVSGDTRPVLYTLYETGKPVDNEESNRNKALFEATFGVIFESDSIYYRRVVGAPEAVIGIDGTFVAPPTSTGDIVYSSAGIVLAKIPDSAEKPEDATYEGMWGSWENNGHYDGFPAVPYVNMDGKLVDMMTNWKRSGSDSRVAAKVIMKETGRERRKSLHYYASDVDKPSSPLPRSTPEKLTDSKEFRYQVCGLPALIAGFSVSTGDTFKELSNGLLLGSIYFGCDKSTYASGASLGFNATSYVMHYTGDYLATQVYMGDVTFNPDIIPTNVEGDIAWVKEGGPNAITDWLTWLKTAKLEDAEDILTICIIAILQWLPRIFMFIFFILMGLSMIATVKPWVVFCDRFFDPYKFLTAGRMTVHTIEIKKVVACSMIALILFGLFQNGLILDIIAWCARAVTGILNR